MCVSWFCLFVFFSSILSLRLKGQDIIISRKKIKEEYVSFNNALNTFYLRLYDVGHIVKDRSDSER